MLQFILSGLAIGAIYGLIGISLSMSFYVTRVINFAQGQMAMLAIVSVGTVCGAGFSPWIGVPIGLAFAGLAGVLSYLIAVRPILLFNRFSFGWLVSTLGFALILENGTAYFLGPESRPFPALLNDISVRFGGAALTGQQILAIFMAVAVAIAFELVRKRTLFGKVGIATAADPDMASAIGVNIVAVAVVTFLIAGLLSGVAGILIGPRTFANPYLGGTFGTAGFVAMMIGGGTEKPVAAIWGGFLLGILAEGANAVINSQASDWFPFLALVVVLILRPQGLFSSGLLDWLPRRGGAQAQA